MSSATTATDPLDLIDIPTITENVSNSHLIAALNNQIDTCNNSDFITATSIETSIPTQLAQWVYIQTPPKITMSSNALNKNNPIVVNTVAPLQISSLGTTNKNLPLSQAITVPTNQGVILAHPVSNNSVKQQHLFIQKPVPVSNVGAKNTLAYLTMIKTPQHLSAAAAASQTPPNQKYVIAPMPKLTTNRLPATMTTNCVQSKIALMPVSLQNTMSKPAATKHKVFNLKIADGQLQSENNGAITVMCDNSTEKDEVEVTSYFKCIQEDNKLVCNEIIYMDNPEKRESIEDKSYELSIVEDSGSKNDVSFTITIPDETDKTRAHPYNNKYPKHGVSILKKNCNIAESLKPEKSNLIISPVPNSITTISDSNTKEVKITSTSNYTPSSSSDEPVIITEHKTIPQKSERRRKSNFAYRKDYDEVIVTSNPDPEDEPIVTVTKSSSNSSTTMEEDVVEIKVIKEKPDINMNDFDAKKILSWEDGIGTLPGSEIKFHINEFGILEYLKKDEYKQITDKKSSKPKNNKKEEFQEEMRCLECGCYGMPSEFISPKYCSYDCQEIGSKAAKQREAKAKRRTKAWIKKNSELSTEIKIDELSDEEQNTSNENSQDKFNYPWNCTKKGFSWPKYLEHIKATAAPVKFFKDPFPYNRNGFRPGMKLEGVDPQHPSYFCVLSVAAVSGYRLRLRFDGYSENYDFWVNADSMDIFPAGWCEKYGHVLHPPPGYTATDFCWTSYLKQTKSTVAPKHLFANRAGSAICPNGFRVGMKLEAVDRKNHSLVCVATVSDMMDNRILVHFDSWDDIYDYWADPTSPYIHPVGWCDQRGHSLTPPNACRERAHIRHKFSDYPNPETFTWEKYLKESKSVAAPVRAFKQRPIYGFKRGMRLECVDKRVPQLIRAATVDDTREHQLRISFDGWPDRYSYWVDNDSPNIHPVGWCQKTGHPIEPPLTPDDVYDFLECPTVGCRGQGHIQGPQFPTHSCPKDCPYSDENMNREHILPDRLLSPDRQLESVVPISREPRDNKPKPRLGRPPKMPRRDPSIKTEWIEDETEPEDTKPLKRKLPRTSKSSTEGSIEKICKKESVPLTNGYANMFVEQIWEKHSRHLSQHLKNNTDPREWREDEVVRFITNIPSCRNHGALFREHKIDGEALLMLSQRDLVEILHIKLGPAIKLYSIIVLLRRSVLS